MKQNMKKLWAVLCVTVCLFALVGCSKADSAAKEIDPSVTMALQQGTAQYLDLFASMTVQELEDVKASSEKSKDTAMLSAANSWLSVKDDLGGQPLSRQMMAMLPGSMPYLKKEKRIFPLS